MNPLHKAMLEEAQRQQIHFNKIASLLSDEMGFRLILKFLTLDKMSQQIFIGLLSLDINDLVETAIKFPKLKDSVVSIIKHKEATP